MTTRAADPGDTGWRRSSAVERGDVAERTNSLQLEFEAMARTKRASPYKGPKRMLATMACYVSCPKKPAKVNKYIYTWHTQADGRRTKRRIPNPAYEA